MPVPPLFGNACRLQLRGKSTLSPRSLDTAQCPCLTCCDAFKSQGGDTTTTTNTARKDPETRDGYINSASLNQTILKPTLSRISCSNLVFSFADAVRPGQENGECELARDGGGVFFPNVGPGLLALLTLALPFLASNAMKCSISGCL